ncbi:hypothetical protein A6U97_02485 [Agrobacterium tumefaciens]|uniref:hypothetical protein n=1 Tax=Agrobacterium tumefaciens TaxID=358 RepID=UPI00080FAC84|nr:hypothetical protein A6U97_02485 [Agrobacterium tumefaciens]
MTMRNRFEDMSSEEAFRRVQELDSSLCDVAYDPIFTPIFAGLGFGSFTIAGISGASIASAIAVTPISEGVQRA